MRYYTMLFVELSLQNHCWHPAVPFVLILSAADAMVDPVLDSFFDAACSSAAAGNVTFWLRQCSGVLLVPVLMTHAEQTLHTPNNTCCHDRNHDKYLLVCYNDRKEIICSFRPSDHDANRLDKSRGIEENNLT